MGDTGALIEIDTGTDCTVKMILTNQKILIASGQCICIDVHSYES